MLTLSHSIDISASPHRVWEVLTDTAAYPEWNPFMTELSGTLQVGSRLFVTIEPPGARSQRFTPTVTVLEPEHRLEWLGRLLAPGLFDGTHSFVLETLDATTTRFTQSERFTGLLVPLLRGMLRATEEGFAEMDAALAARAES